MKKLLMVCIIVASTTVLAGCGGCGGNLCGGTNISYTAYSSCGCSSCWY